MSLSIRHYSIDSCWPFATCSWQLSNRTAASFQVFGRLLEFVQTDSANFGLLFLLCEWMNIVAGASRTCPKKTTRRFATSIPCTPQVAPPSMSSHPTCRTIPILLQARPRIPRPPRPALRALRPLSPCGVIERRQVILLSWRRLPHRSTGHLGERALGFFRVRKPQASWKPLRLLGAYPHRAHPSSLRALFATPHRRCTWVPATP